MRWWRRCWSKWGTAYERVALPAGVVLPWVGGVLLALAAVFALHSWWRARPLQRAAATVTENVAAFSPRGGVQYYPRLRFRTAEGDIVVVLSRRGSDDPDWKPGEIVPVMYPQGEPRAAKIATTWRVYYVAFVLGIWGAALFDVGLVVQRARQQQTDSRR